MTRYEDRIKYLAAALVFLLLLWGAGEFFAPERTAARSESFTLLAGKVGDVTLIELNSAGSTLRLEKAGGQWALVDGKDRLPVQSSRVDALLSSLSKAGRKRPVATKKDAWAGLGLDGTKAKYLKISDAAGKVMLDLYTGNRGTTGSELYVRFGTAEGSFTIDSGVASFVSPDRASWLDRRLFHGTMDTSAVQAFSVKADVDLGGTASKPLRIAWRFERAGAGWKGSNRELDAVAVESALRAALNLEAVDLSGLGPVGAFDRIGASIDFDLGSGKKRLIEVGNPAGDGRFWVRASENGTAAPYAFQLSSYSLGTVLKDEGNYVKK